MSIPGKEKVSPSSRSALSPDHIYLAPDPDREARPSLLISPTNSPKSRQEKEGKKEKDRRHCDDARIRRVTFNEITQRA